MRAGMTVILGDSADISEPSALIGGSTTWTRWAPLTTWALVMM